LEANYRVTEDVKVRLNYAFVEAEDKETDERFGIGPYHQLFADVQWQIGAGWSLYGSLNWIPEWSDYALAALAIRRRAPDKRWDVTLRVDNVFNQHTSEPTTFPDLLPGGVPLPERAVAAQLRLHFF
jgi:outer membrane receptor protein involved in Fe transport